jgi:hypothetical protein
MVSCIGNEKVSSTVCCDTYRPCKSVINGRTFALAALFSPKPGYSHDETAAAVNLTNAVVLGICDKYIPGTV